MEKITKPDVKRGVVIILINSFQDNRLVVFVNVVVVANRFRSVT